MANYIALLRGVNVGGNNKVKMADLKRLFEDLGFENVKTVIQSGNVLFQSYEDDARLLRSRIEDQIRVTFGIPVTVMLRTAKELYQVIDDCPFQSDALSDGESIHVCFCTDPLPHDKIGVLAEGGTGPDEFQFIGRELYILYRQSILDSQLAKRLPKLGVLVTDRNWNTVNKLAELARQQENQSQR